MCPAAHSGHWSITWTVTDPSGPVTVRYPPQAAALSYSDGESATNRPFAGGLGYEQLGRPVST